ncbi:MAG: PAS domain-containing protein [Myxococcales bacterium]|nr:PAS domain-containing protein [Myxococcales bacterium]
MRAGRLQLRLFAYAAIAVVACEVTLVALVQRGPVLPHLPWAELAAETYASLVALCVAFFCFGRHRVTGEPSSLWVGLAFLSYSLLAAVYVLVYPEVLNGRAVLAVHPNAFGWPFHYKWTALGALLLAASLLRAPHQREARRADLALIAATSAGCLAVVAVTFVLGRHFPPLVEDGKFTPLNVHWIWALTALFAASAMLAYRAQRRRPPGMLGYAAALSAICSARLGTDIFGGQLYDTVWYFNRAVLVGSFTLMLAVLLADHVELLRSERQLSKVAKERELQLRATLESMAEAVLVADSELRVVDFNSAAAELLSRLSGEQPVRPFSEVSQLVPLVSREGSPIASEEHPAVTASRGKVVRSFLARSRGAGGEERILEISAAPLGGPSPAPTGAVMVFRDVTQLEWARSTDTVARIATAVATARSTPELVRAVLTDGAAALHARVAFLCTLEPKRSELRLEGQQGLPADVVEKLRRFPLEAPLIAAAAVRIGRIQIDQDPAHSEYEMTRELAGRLGSKLVVAVPLFFQGQPRGVLVYHVVEERRLLVGPELEALRIIGDVIAVGLENARLYDQAQEERQRLKAIFDASPEGIILFEAGTGRIFLANEAAARLVGQPLDAEAPMAAHPQKYGLFRPEGTTYPAQELPSSRALRGEVVVGEEVLMRTPGGDVPVLVNAAPVRDEGGVVTGAVALFQDISRAKELEREREAFLHAVSHDLRTPLTIILAQAQMAVGPLATPERVEKAAGAISRAGRRMNALIQDLLVSAAIESGQVGLALAKVDLASFIAGLKERLTGAMEVERVRLVSPAGLPNVVADPDRLERILLNLLGNALKYGAPGTEVTVTLSQEGQELWTSITDRGPGIPPEELPRLFSRYYRAKGARERKEGLGLGLYIAKGLVEAQGGRVRVESRLGEGSTFSFSMPSA